MVAEAHLLAREGHVRSLDATRRGVRELQLQLGLSVPIWIADDARTL